MHITLTGNLGSGKSTLSKLLERDYGYEVFSTGKVIRTIAEEQGVSVLEINKRMESDPQYDHMIDDTTARISKEQKEKKLLFDSRLAWNFVEDSFKVFLSVSLDVAAVRVMSDNRGKVERYASLEDCKADLLERAATEDRRYKKLYGINYFNFSNYDLVLDSTECDPETLAKLLMDEAKRYEEKKKAGDKTGTRLVLSEERPLEEFAAEKERGAVSTQEYYGRRFRVIEM